MPLHLTKKLIQGLRDKTVSEAIAETEAQKGKAVLELQQAMAVEQVHSAQATESRVDFDRLHEEVALRIDEELASAVNFRELRAHQNDLKANTNAYRWKLLEAEQNLAMLEMIALNRTRMKEIEERAQAAARVASEANTQLAEEKRLRKQSLRNTSRVWNEMQKRGSKRNSQASTCNKEPLPKRSALQAEEYAPTIAQSSKSLSRRAQDESTCTLFEDAQPRIL